LALAVLYRQVVLILYLAALLLRVVVTVLTKLLEQRVMVALVVAGVLKPIGLRVQAHQDKGMTAVLVLLIIWLMLAVEVVVVNPQLVVLEHTRLGLEETAVQVEHHQYLEHQFNMLVAAAVVARVQPVEQHRLAAVKVAVRILLAQQVRQIQVVVAVAAVILVGLLLALLAVQA